VTRALNTAEHAALKQFTTELRRLLGDNLLALRLFGSRARGEGSEESDLDVLVVLRDKDRVTCRRIVQTALDADLTHGVNLAPTIVTQAEYDRNREYQTPFYRNVEREGIAL
jgi:predicted nucleotidyltransferase